MVRLVVFAETGPCRELEDRLSGGGVVLKCLTGDKESALRRYGIPDDDYYFAMEFLRTCNNHPKALCVAVVRDDDVERHISRLLRKRYSSLAERVRVVRIPFLTRRQDVLKLVEVIIWVSGGGWS